MSDSQDESAGHSHRFRHLTTNVRSEQEELCDRMADIVNLTTSDLYQRVLQFALENLGDKKYEWLRLAKCISNFCSDTSPHNFDYITSFDRMVQNFATNRPQMLADIRRLHSGMCEVAGKLKEDFGELKLDEEDVTLMVIGAAHPDYQESLNKRRKMLTLMFFSHLEDVTDSLQKDLAGELRPGDRIGVGIAEQLSAQQQALPRDTSLALAALFAVLLGNFHEDVAQHYATLEGHPKAKEFEAALGTVLQALVEYEKSEHAELSHVDKRVAECYAKSIEPALKRVIDDLTPKIEAQGNEPDVRQTDILNATESLMSSFEAYRKERPLARREPDRQ